MTNLCSMRAILIALTLLVSHLGAVFTTLAQGTAVATPAAEFVHGVDLADMDLSVAPEVDFYEFANGGWLNRTVIPADRPAYDVFTALNDRTIAQLLNLLRSASGPDGALPGSDQAKAATLFTQGMDTVERDRQGLEPIRDAIDRIAAIDSEDAYHAYLERAYHAYLERAPFDGVGATLPLSVFPDLNESTTNALYLGGPTLGLPNRDYYLDDEPSLVPVRETYVETGAALLTAAGYTADEAQEVAQAVYDFEKALAAETLTREQQQDFSLQNNPMTLDELTVAYPDMNWSGYLRSVGVSGVDEVIVTETGYVKALSGIIDATPIETLRAYLMLGLVSSWAEALSDELGETAFRFSQVLTGLEARPMLEERVLDQVNGAVPDAVGKLYVSAHFPPEAKAAIEELTQDVLAAFRDRLEANLWMTAETKAKAVEKLDAVTVKVGYPEEWETYEAVEPAESYAGSLRSALEVRLREEFAKAGNPVDRTEWDIPSQLVNAFYNPLANEIVFPAAILQPPFFDYEADPASNYGAIGYVIGHEITHGFDLIGSQFDSDGNFANWWTNEDRERFLALNEALAEQYAAIEVAPGLFVNGQITVGENTADLGGIQNAYAALLFRLVEEGGAPGASPVAGATPVAAGVISPPFTPEQRFFIAAASVWRNKTRPEFLELLVRSDSHAPGSVRATQPLRNADPFFSTFRIEAGDPMWLPPEERIVIW
ncbi:MAG TPA: M13 family metallopeptidase [Thermomicrobiales bacterium]|nr:M13 family metallopeptidase [Thermomicrobiales bacterium]